jgi:arylsulfatase A-like enzyme
MNQGIRIWRIPRNMNYPHTISCVALAAITLSPSLVNADPPNIVLIFVDDLGYGDLGSYGGDMIPTPSIDALADQGMRFTDAYVVSPVCGPSRVGLLTGAYPQRFGVYWNTDATRAEIPDEWTLLPELMREAGYRTGIVGKWNITRDVTQSADEVYDPMIWGGDYWPDENGVHGGVGGGWGDRKEQGVWGPRREGDEYLTDRLTQHAVNFIEANKEQPFFLYLAYNAPHSPLQAQDQYREQLAHIESEPLRLYAAMVMALMPVSGRSRRPLKPTD